MFDEIVAGNLSYLICMGFGFALGVAATWRRQDRRDEAAADRPPDDEGED